MAQFKQRDEVPGQKASYDDALKAIDSLVGRRVRAGAGDEPTTRPILTATGVLEAGVRKRNAAEFHLLHGGEVVATVYAYRREFAGALLGREEDCLIVGIVHEGVESVSIVEEED